MKLSTHFFAALGLSLCFATGARAQSSVSSGNNSKFFTQWGYSPLLGAAATPLSSYTTYSYDGYNAATGTYARKPVTLQARLSSYEDVAFLFRARMNIKEFSSNAALSVSVMPALAISSASQGGLFGGATTGGGLGLGTLDIPVFIEYNIGNVATYIADQDKGMVIGLGIEYMNTPLIGGGAAITDEDGNPATAKLITGWVEPAIEIGYRHWNKRNKAKEINLKAGFGAGGSFSVRLSWMKCIGY